MELIILIALALFAYSYRMNATDGAKGAFKFIQNGVTSLYDKYAPYSFKQVREKTKELGEEYTVKQYISQVVLFGVVAGGIAYLYFYNLFITIIYAAIAIAFIAY